MNFIYTPNQPNVNFPLTSVKRRATLSLNVVMIDIATWRARIGLHNASIGGSCGKTANVCRNVHLLHGCLLRLHGLLLSVLLALTTTTLGHVMMVITTLLLLAGDVELNPGPTLGEKKS